MAGRNQPRNILLLLTLIVLTGSDGRKSSECCLSVLLDSVASDHQVVGNRLGFFHQFGQYGARPAYKSVGTLQGCQSYLLCFRQAGGDYFIFFDEGRDVWTETRYFFGASLFSRLESDNTNYCLESYNNWSRYNGTTMIFAEQMKAECLTIEQVCCRDIRLSSANVNKTKSNNESLYQSNALGALGDYIAIGMKGGRWVYQKKWEDRYLEYGDKYWLGNTGVGKSSGHIHHDGGSVCPEDIKGEWQISSKDSEGHWSWHNDLELVVTCVTEETSHTQPPPSRLIKLRQEELRGSRGYYPSAVAFGVISMLLAVLLLLFLARRFRQAWGRGAQGTKLIMETLELPL